MRAKSVAFILLALLLTGSAALHGDAPFSPRALRIGKQLICTCGCQQGALTCSTLNCTVKVQMQAEIRQRARLAEPESLVLQSFVQEYGTEVLANPTHVGFNQTAWVLPWVVLGLGLLLVLYVVKRFRGRQQPEPAPAAAPGADEVRIRSEISAELEREL
ncbi:MAG: cytochrome c-type biogenesis protein CcmH [Terriglobales bacterium]